MYITCWISTQTSKHIVQKTGGLMKQILIATHGKMASGIRYTAELIVGKMPGITTIDAYVDPEDNIVEKFNDFFREHEGERIIVFTDMMGGSVNQKLMEHAKSDNVTLVTGTNLPVLLQVMLAGDDVTDDEIEGYIEESRNELQLVSNGDAKTDMNVEKKNTADVNEDKTEENPKLAVSYENSDAKIAALRVDDRLIHGQVAMTWTKQLKVNGIVVANDDAANDNTQKMALKMAVPAGIKVLIKPVNEAIRVLNDPRAAKMRILVLTRNVKDALTVRKQVGEIEFLNIGNTGRFDGIDVSEKKLLSPTIMLTEDEIKNLKELVEIDPKTCMQQVPNDERKLVKDVINTL